MRKNTLTGLPVFADLTEPGNCRMSGTIEDHYSQC